MSYLDIVILFLTSSVKRDSVQINNHNFISTVFWRDIDFITHTLPLVWSRWVFGWTLAGCRCWRYGCCLGRMGGVRWQWRGAAGSQFPRSPTRWGRRALCGASTAPTLLASAAAPPSMTASLATPSAGDRYHPETTPLAPAPSFPAAPRATYCSPTRCPTPVSAKEPTPPARALRSGSPGGPLSLPCSACPWRCGSRDPLPLWLRPAWVSEGDYAA